MAKTKTLPFERADPYESWKSDAPIWWTFDDSPLDLVEADEDFVERARAGFVAATPFWYAKTFSPEDCLDVAVTRHWIREDREKGQRLRTAQKQREKAAKLAQKHRVCVICERDFWADNARCCSRECTTELSTRTKLANRAARPLWKVVRCEKRVREHQEREARYREHEEWYERMRAMESPEDRLAARLEAQRFADAARRSRD